MQFLFFIFFCKFVRTGSLSSSAVPSWFLRNCHRWREFVWGLFARWVFNAHLSTFAVISFLTCWLPNWRALAALWQKFEAQTEAESRKQFLLLSHLPLHLLFHLLNQTTFWLSSMPTLWIYIYIWMYSYMHTFILLYTCLYLHKAK